MKNMVNMISSKAAAGEKLNAFEIAVLNSFRANKKSLLTAEYAARKAGRTSCELWALPIAKKDALAAVGLMSETAASDSELRKTIYKQAFSYSMKDSTNFYAEKAAVKKMDPELVNIKEILNVLEEEETIPEGRVEERSLSHYASTISKARGKGINISAVYVSKDDAVTMLQQQPYNRLAAALDKGIGINTTVAQSSLIGEQIVGLTLGSEYVQRYTPYLVKLSLPQDEVIVDMFLKSDKDGLKPRNLIFQPVNNGLVLYVETEEGRYLKVAKGWGKEPVMVELSDIEKGGKYYIADNRFYTSSAGALKKGETIIPLIPSEGEIVPDWEAIFNWVTNGAYGMLKKYVDAGKVSKLSLKQIAQWSMRMSQYSAPNNAYEDANIGSLFIYPGKYGNTTDGAGLANRAMLQEAVNNDPMLSRFFFTKKACEGHQLQMRSLVNMIKGTFVTVHEYTMGLRALRAAEQFGKFVYYPGMYQGEELEAFKLEFAEYCDSKGKKGGRIAGKCFVLFTSKAEAEAWEAAYEAYQNRANVTVEEEVKMVMTLANGLFADFNMVKTMFDPEGPFGGLNILSVAHLSKKMNTAVQALTGNMLGDPGLVKNKLGGLIDERCEKKREAWLTLETKQAKMTDLLPMSRIDIEGNPVEAEPNHNELRDSLMPVLKFIDPATGRKVVEKTMEGMNDRLEHLKFQTEGAHFMLCTDLAALIGLRKGGVLKGKTDDKLNVFYIGWDKKEGRLLRFPKPTVSNSINIHSVSAVQYINAVLESDMDVLEKAVTIRAIMTLKEGTLILPDDSSVFTTLDGADIDGDSGYVDPDAEMNAVVPETICIYKPKNADAIPYNDDFLAQLQAKAETDEDYKAIAAWFEGIAEEAKAKLQ